MERHSKILALVYAIPLLFGSCLAAKVMTQFRNDAALNEQICPSEDIIMITDNVQSDIQCTLQCSDVSTCVGGFYQPQSKRCVHCRSKTAAAREVLVGSLFYGRAVPTTTATSTVTTDSPVVKFELRLSEVDVTVDYTSGFLEAFTNNQWNRVCHYAGWNWKTTTVACKQLHESYLYGGTFHKQWYKRNTSSSGYDVVKFENLDCTGREGRLEECSSSLTTTSCETTYEMALTCFKYNFSEPGLSVAIGDDPEKWNNLTDSGHLWVKVNGIWGKICVERKWGYYKTTTPCRSLNPYWWGIAFDSDNYNGSVIHATNLECDGNEQHLFNCVNDGWDKRNDCEQDRVANIICKT